MLLSELTQNPSHLVPEMLRGRFFKSAAFDINCDLEFGACFSRVVCCIVSYNNDTNTLHQKKFQIKIRRYFIKFTN